ncbi:MAG: PEP/pyruvate-binding domain-containing protein [bacterium]
MKFTKLISDIDKGDVSIAGGKGASLGEMAGAGIAMPGGFVVLAGAFDKFLAEANIVAEVKSVLGSVDTGQVHTVDDASEKIRGLILGADIPSQIVDEIKSEFGKLGAEFVAVRSSATAEDGATAAWAGQLETYLNSTSADLVANVQKCWASLFTPRAIFYRAEQGLGREPVSVAVVVQKMIESDVSGVAFSVHPVTQDLNQLIIEASFGLGEAIVSGQVTPDSYVVSKSNGKIVSRTVHAQNRALVRSATGGNAWQEVPEEKGKGQVLSDEQIAELASMVIKIENHYGFPVDIEWAYADGRLKILQARPITTLPDQQPVKSKIDKASGEAVDYIKSQKWFLGTRAEESLFYFSAKLEGQRRFMESEYGVPFVEAVLAPKEKDFPVRIYNRRQAVDFHKVSEQRVLDEPAVLEKFLAEDEELWQEIESECVELEGRIDQKDEGSAVASFKAIVENYSRYGFHFFVIFSLGMKLTEHRESIDEAAKVILGKHDLWRNRVALEEEKLGKCLFEFLDYLTSTKQLALEPVEIMKYLTVDEVVSLVDGKLGIDEARDLVDRRKGGYVYLGLRNIDKVVVDDPTQVAAISGFVTGLVDEVEGRLVEACVVKGQATFTGEPVRGEVVVVRDDADLEAKGGSLAGKILVTVQTRPKFMQYLKGVKAIVTDEGGITCHAAIISREMRIPCVIGTTVGTRVLRDGMEVEVDFESGEVKNLKG